MIAVGKVARLSEKRRARRWAGREARRRQGEPEVQRCGKVAVTSKGHRLKKAEGRTIRCSKRRERRRGWIGQVGWLGRVESSYVRRPDESCRHADRAATSHSMHQASRVGMRRIIGCDTRLIKAASPWFFPRLDPLLNSLDPSPTAVSRSTIQCLRCQVSPWPCP